MISPQQRSLTHPDHASERKKPASAALIKFDKVAANKARSPKREISSRRIGAIAPNPPNRIAMDYKFANPHRANTTMAEALVENSVATPE